MKYPFLAKSVNANPIAKSSVSMKLNDLFTLSETETDTDTETDIEKVTMDAYGTVPISMRNRLRFHCSLPSVVLGLGLQCEHVLTLLLADLDTNMHFHHCHTASEVLSTAFFSN